MRGLSRLIRLCEGLSYSGIPGLTKYWLPITYIYYLHLTEAIVNIIHGRDLSKLSYYEGYHNANKYKNSRDCRQL